MTENVIPIVKGKPRGGTRATVLLCSDKGSPIRCAENIIRVLRDDPRWKGRIAYDEFSQRPCVIQRLPSDEHDRILGTDWTDTDSTRCAAWLSSNCGLFVTSALVFEAILVVAELARFHAVRSYLQEKAAKAWDGYRRLESWLVTYGGAQRSPLVGLVGEWWMISAVARVMRPGCKADHCLIFEAAQGKYKSKALSILASPAWFTDEIGDLGSRDAAMCLRGKWIVELPELDALSRAEVTRAKAFFSRSVDRYRDPYGRSPRDYPRQCVFSGTTNADAYLRDVSGARRFWPVQIRQFDIDALERDRDLLWGEALALFEDNVPWWPTTDEHRMALAAEAEQRRVCDTWEERIDDWLGRHKDWGSSSPITTSRILEECLSKPLAQWQKTDEMRVAEVMKGLGWTNKGSRVRYGGRNVRAWRREVLAP